MARKRNQAMSDFEITLRDLDETVSELDQLMAVLAERLGAKPVTETPHYQDK
jgi:hypothetical protein